MRRSTVLRLPLSTVDLLVLDNLDELLFIMNILFTFITKQATLVRSVVLSLPLQPVLPGWGFTKLHVKSRKEIMF
jgi:hypothetical protein